MTFISFWLSLLIPVVLLIGTLLYIFVRMGVISLRSIIVVSKWSAIGGVLAIPATIAVGIFLYVIIFFVNLGKAPETGGIGIAGPVDPLIMVTLLTVGVLAPIIIPLGVLAGFFYGVRKTRKSY